MTPARILIVDRDESATQDLKTRLSRLGYEVVGVAASTEEAIQVSARLNPSLVLINTNLRSEGDGIQTGQLLHSKIEAPIIYIAARAGQNTIRWASSTGPFGYIIQPYEQSQLLATIEIAQIRHKLESQLRESEGWLNGVLMSIGDGVIAVDKTGAVQFINSKAEKITGLSETQAIGKSLLEALPLKDERSGELVDLSASLSSGLQKDGNDSRMEALLITPAGKGVPLEINFSPISDPTHNCRGLVLAFRDISERRHTLEQVKRQAERAETLLQVASQISTQVELEAILKRICEAISRTLKCRGAAILLKDVKRGVFRSAAVTDDLRLAGNDQDAHFEAPIGAFQMLMDQAKPAGRIMKARSYPSPQAIETLQKLNIQSMAVIPLLRQETELGIMISFFPQGLEVLPEEDGKLIRGLADQAVTAIANTSYLEEVRASRERQQFLARELVRVQEEERRSLARELHDEIGQMLTGLQFTLKSILTPDADEKQRNKLDQAQIIVSAIISQIRELSINLRPSLLDDLGILHTLSWYFNRYEAKTGIQVFFEHHGLDQRFNTELETTAFRIAQEALTNAARYANTDRVDVSILVHESVMQIQIQDQGDGFDMAGLAKNQSLGIEGMRERAYAIGGLLKIESEPGKGTRVQASLPVSGFIERRKHERDHSPGR